MKKEEFFEAHDGVSQGKNFDDVSEAQDLWKKFMEVSYFLIFL